VRAGPNFEVAVPTLELAATLFQNPSGTYYGSTGYTPHSESLRAGQDLASINLVGDGAPIENLYDMYFGETIKSYRALLKRFVLAFVMSTSPATVNTQAYLDEYQFVPYPVPSVIGVTNSSNWTYLSWMRVNFLQWRGGTRWKFRNVAIQPSSASAPPLDRFYAVKVSRFAYPLIGNSTSATNCVTAGQIWLLSAGNTISSAHLLGIAGTGQAGMIDGCGTTLGLNDSSTIEVDFPMADPVRFRLGNAPFYQNSPITEYGKYITLRPSTGSSGITNWIEAYSAASEDVSLSWFLGAPRMYIGTASNRT